VLTEIRRLLTGDLEVRLEGPSKVALLLYDNGALVVESFRDEAVDLRVVADRRVRELINVSSGEALPGDPVETQGPGIRRREPGREEHAFRLRIPPHSYLILQSR
jgi:hypothetical protein